MGFNARKSRIEYKDVLEISIVAPYERQEARQLHV